LLTVGFWGKSVKGGLGKKTGGKGKKVKRPSQTSIEPTRRGTKERGKNKPKRRKRLGRSLFPYYS